MCGLYRAAAYVALIGILFASYHTVFHRTVSNRDMTGITGTSLAGASSTARDNIVESFETMLKSEEHARHSKNSHDALNYYRTHMKTYLDNKISEIRQLESGIEAKVVSVLTEQYNKLLSEPYSEVRSDIKQQIDVFQRFRDRDNGWSGVVATEKYASVITEIRTEGHRAIKSVVEPDLLKAYGWINRASILDYQFTQAQHFYGGERAHSLQKLVIDELEPHETRLKQQVRQIVDDIMNEFVIVTALVRDYVA